MKHARSNTGFTLVELMVVIAILGIIMGIAIPSYSGYVIKAKRSEGRRALLDVAAQLERYYSDNNVFATAANTLPASIQTKIGGAAYSELYTITVATADPYQAFTLTATPQFDDDGCACYTYTHAGAKGICPGSEKSLDACW